MICVTPATDNPPKRGTPSDELARRLRMPLERLRLRTGAGLAFAGRVLPGTADHIELFAFDGDVVGPLRGANLYPGHGLGGRVIGRRRAAAVHDYVRSPLITHTYDEIIRAENLRAMVAAPIIVGRKHIGVLYAARRNPHDQLGVSLDAVADEARGVEQQLAVADVLATLRTDDEERDLAAWRAQIQDSHARLRALADTTSDAALRDQMLDIADGLAHDSPFDEPSVHLTAREQDVLGLLAAGLPNATIADRLGIGVYTVKDHVKRLLVKLDASTRFEAVVNARRVRLIP
ncbi:regulatory protein, luxR family [Gordonia malaquae]|uniref:Putative LuxR family transcriptional regulator n=2 Tax=Gordonia TaxID=2053 RepID=M3VAQ0_GORML|nr:LuxR C-terminal-related transcriptional regulator [Gordonia malaquae]GAC79048.1 putative LuxR family transcriptional regulator [Gordonia malaquae NBRC 108250]SEE12602.1 regulatory protein, luxR family [Gordonia malaquae]